MENTSFMRVEEVAQELGVSKSYAYKIVQKLNEELKSNPISASAAETSLLTRKRRKVTAPSRCRNSSVKKCRTI